jgi:hypothetical protein
VKKNSKFSKAIGGKALTYVSFLLDETGSMASIKDDTIGGFNAYLDTIQKDKNDYRFTLIKFDSNHTTKVCVAEKVKHVPRLNNDNYTPGAMTPLIDACMETIAATERQTNKLDKQVHVLCVFQTDGHENCSTRHKRSDLAAKIKEKQEEGWAFIFLGANIDAYADATSFGIDYGSTVSYDSRTSNETLGQTLGRATAAYASSGSAMRATFTADEKKRAGDGGSAG